MALRNPFSSREKQVSDSNLRDMQRSEAPTGAIGRLSSKVRNMVNAVATRVRWFVSDSWDVAKFAAFSAVAAAAPNVANAGDNMVPSQSLNQNAQWSVSARLDDGSKFVLSGGPMQHGDNIGGVVRVQKSDENSAIGGVVAVVPWVTTQVGIVAAGRLNYSVDANDEKSTFGPGGMFHWGAKAQDESIRALRKKLKQQFIASGMKAEDAEARAEEEANKQKEPFGTTYSGGLIFNQTDAREVFGPNVGRGPLTAASVLLGASTNISSTTLSSADATINLSARYDRAFDETLSTTNRVKTTTYEKDLPDRRETWTDVSTTTLSQEYHGYDRGEVRVWFSGKINDHHALTLETGEVKMRTPSGVSKENSGLTSNIGYMYASDKGNARLGAYINPNGDVTYNANVSFQPNKKYPVAAEIFASKTESQDNAVVGVGLKWRIGGSSKNPNPTQVAWLMGRTPEGFVNEFGYTASNTSIYQYGNGTLVNSEVAWPTTSTLLSTEMKNTGAALSLSLSKLSLIAGTPQSFQVVVSDATPLSISQTGNILAREVSKQVLPDGKVRYTIEVSSNSDVVTNDTKVLLSAGTTQESVIVTVTPAPPKNSAPVANSDAEVTDWKKAITLDVLANDTDKEGDALTLAAATVNTDLAQVAIVDNKLLFTPKEGVAGQIIVSYTVRDAHGNESIGVATFNVKKPPVIDIGVSAKSISIQQANTSVSAPITLTLPQGITEANIDFSSLPKGIHMVRRQAPQVRSFARSARALPEQAVGFQVRSALLEPQPEPTYALEYDIVVDSDALVGTHQITAIVKIDNEQQGNPQDLFALTIEAKTPQNSDPILSAPGVSFTGDQGITLTNNLSDADGISNLVYIVVDANGNEIPSSSANFSNLKPGNYTAYTQALAYNPDTNSSKIAQSATVSFSIATPDTPPTVYAPTIEINGQSIIATNYITDPDGVVDISYILVGSGGFEMPRLDGNFTNLPPGNYTLFTKARVRNATTGAYTDVTSPQSSFVILSPDSKPVLTPPSVLRGRLSASLINNITDNDGISNLVYVVVDANGNENVQPTANFANLRPGSYTAYTQALAYNATTGSSERVTSERTPFTVDAVDTETEFKGSPYYIVDQTTRSVRVTESAAMDPDGIVGHQYYLIAPGVRIANIDGNFTNVPPGTYTLEEEASGIDGATGAVKVATNPNKPTITIEAPKVDAPTIYSDITGVRLGDSSFQITSSGLSDADGEITSLLYIATNTRTGQQLSSANGRFENLDWGDWVVITTGMAKDGATGELKSVKNTDSDKAYRITLAQPVAPNEGGPAISTPTVDRGNDYMVGEYYGCATDLGDITIGNLSANDPDGIGSYTITSQLFGVLSSGTGQLPTSMTIPESTFRGKWFFDQLDEIVIEVSDNHPVNPKKSQRIVKLMFGL